MLQPNVIVHLEHGTEVQTEGGPVTDIDRVAGTRLDDNETLHEGSERVDATRIVGQNGSFIVPSERIDRIQRL